MLIDFIKIYLAKIRIYTIILSILFVASASLGYWLANVYPAAINELIVKNLKDMLEPAMNYPSFQLLGFIFLKNLAASLITVLSGIIFGFIPFLAIFMNGIVIGIVSYIFLGEYNIVVLISGIVPHGIIEIPALVFSAASGVWLWRSIFRRVFYDENKLGKELLSIAKFYAAVIIPMLFAAAIIETFITPFVLSLAKGVF